MVVQIDALCFTSAAVPFEDQPPLLVDADRMEARKIAAQLLEMIAGRHTQILIGRRIVNHLELAKKAAFEIGRDVPGAGILDKESPQPYIPKAHDHAGTPLRVYVPLYGTYGKSALPGQMIDVRRLSAPLRLLYFGRTGEPHTECIPDTQPAIQP